MIFISDETDGSGVFSDLLVHTTVWRSHDQVWNPDYLCVIDLWPCRRSDVCRYAEIRGADGCRSSCRRHACDRCAEAQEAPQEEESTRRRTCDHGTSQVRLLV